MRLQDIHAEIVSTMKQVYTVFKNDGPEVRIYVTIAILETARYCNVPSYDGYKGQTVIAIFCFHYYNTLLGILFIHW